jgi:hypothetical protein
MPTQTPSGSRPGPLRGAGGLDGKLHDIVGGRVQAGDHLAGGGVEDVHCLTALVLDIAAVDVVRRLGLSFHGLILLAGHALAFPYRLRAPGARGEWQTDDPPARAVGRQRLRQDAFICRSRASAD